MDLGIAGRKAIVCASSRGLGRACAKALADAGCEVVINGRDREQLLATAAALHQATGATITPVVADVATTTAVRRFAISASLTGRKCSMVSSPTWWWPSSSRRKPSIR
jgi:3-oxoacyl-[acyl-carrier protein] reductase